MTSARAHYLPPRTRMLADVRPVNISDWVIPATIGSLAGFIAGTITRGLLNGHHDETKNAGAYLVNSGVFLIVGGLTWVYRESHRRG